MTRPLRVDSYAVPMRDGVRLALDVHRPTAVGRRPTILVRTEAGRRDLAARARELDPLDVARAGYAAVFQDIRGRHDSDGVFEALVPDAEDCADTVAWIRGQSWSDGRVLMAGSSYSGCVQLHAARARPAGLLALAPSVSSALRPLWYPGGGLALASIALWFAMLLREALASTSDPLLREPLEELILAPPAERFRALMDPDGWAWELGAPIRHWVTLPAEDPYWTQTTAVPPDPLPAIHTTGPWDLCSSGALATYEAWRGRDEALAPQLLTFGPWQHEFDEFLAFPEVGLAEETLPSVLVAYERQFAFFDTVVRGVPGEGLAPVASFVLGRNRWHEDVRWPPPAVRPHALGLRADGGLSAESADERSPLRYRYDPDDPVPTRGGAYAVLGEAGPLEQSAVEVRQDVLLFTSPCFDGELEVAGSPLARLLVASSAPASAFVVTLTLVTPDGRSVALVSGGWSGRLVDLPEASAGGLRVCEIGLAPLHIALAPGMRLRLQVTSSSSPRLYPHPNVEHDFTAGPPTRTVVAEQVVLTGEGGSTLELPVMGEPPRERAAAPARAS